jgi:NAD(P)-dependent dehydrogenase (short-subunit alcohol dehydrogenase family)
MDLKGKTFVVTGANAGLGKSTCIQLAKRGGNIIMICRSREKGLHVQKEIIRLTQNENIDLQICDFQSLDSVGEIGNQIQNLGPVDVLINNAGAFYSSFGETDDGFERQIGINHLAPFVLTHTLMQRIKESPNGRIVNVSSEAHTSGEIDFKRFRGKPSSYNGMKAYAQSKLANVLFTYELARKLESTNIKVNCLHPGVVNTGIGVKNAKFSVKLIWTLMRPFMSSTRKGASTQVYLAADNIGNASGCYYVKKKSTKSAPLSYNEDLAKKLWEKSMHFTGLNQEI